MTDLPKRLENSLARIRNCGGVVLIHHTSTGSLDYQLPNGGGAFTQHNLQAPRGWPLSLGRGRLIRRGRTNPTCGGRMSKFSDDIKARIAIINQMIPNAKMKERRALQRERTDLEAKLAKATA